MATRHQHDHVNRTGSDLAEAARTALTAKGEQWTDMRGSVFAALAGFDGPVSAYDVAESVGRLLGRRVAANSVYRILDIFVATNVAKRVESRNAYIVNAHPDCRHDCIFLVCDGCGTTAHVDDDILSDGVRAVARSNGFAPDRPILEVRGRCRACA